MRSIRFLFGERMIRADANKPRDVLDMLVCFEFLQALALVEVRIKPKCAQFVAEDPPDRVDPSTATDIDQRECGVL